MPNLKEVKNRIGSVISTQQITKAMKMVAAAKLKRATDNIVQMRPYAKKLNTILSNVTSGLEQSVDNVYSQEREANKVLIIMLTSDKGLCGAFNGNVLKMTRQLITGKYASQFKAGNVSFMPIGRKAAEYIKKSEYPAITDFSGLFIGLNFNDARKAAEFAMKGFAAGKYDKVELVYNEFKNVATQILKVEQFLPITQNVSSSDSFDTNTDYIFEPSKEYILQELIPTSLKVQFYKSLLESYASENGARMTAMDKATENAGELLKELKLTYNRTRQAAITKEILEIVAGAEALSGK